jgi:hypothetical protein
MAGMKDQNGDWEERGERESGKKRKKWAESSENGADSQSAHWRGINRSLLHNKEPKPTLLGGETNVLKALLWDQTKGCHWIRKGEYLTFRIKPIYCLDIDLGCLEQFEVRINTMQMICGSAACSAGCKERSVFCSLPAWHSVSVAIFLASCADDSAQTRNGTS